MIYMKSHIKKSLKKLNFYDSHPYHYAHIYLKKQLKIVSKKQVCNSCIYLLHMYFNSCKHLLPLVKLYLLNTNI